MRQIHNSDRSDNSEVSNGTSPFALFRGRWGRSALRASGRAPWHRSTRAVEADPGPGEGAWIYAIRPVAARSETKRGREVVLERCATDSARGRGGEATRRAGGYRQSRNSATRICRVALLAWGGARLVSSLPTPAAGRGVGTASHAVESAGGSRSIRQARCGIHLQPGKAGRRYR